MNSQQGWPDPRTGSAASSTPPPPTVPPSAGSAPAPSKAPSPASDVFSPLAPDDPRMVAGYQIRAKLGAGGMGKVYLSYTPGGRPVAIKVIRPDFAEDPEFRRRFKQEVESAQRVQGLYTAPVIDRDTEAPVPWLATAYVPGPSLHAAVAEHGALPVPTVLLLVAGIAEALQVIHGAGIVHRDLKPANVLLASDGPRVIDFGIARAADATSLTASGVTVGSPAFMAPEQASGTGVSPATDVFALGQVAAFAATGAPPFGEGTSTAVLYRIVHEEPDLSRVPEELRELVSRCLTKDPAARPDIAEIIALCSRASGQTSLRRPEDWVPSAVAADITRRTNAPVPPTPPPAPAPTPTVADGAGVGHGVPTHAAPTHAAPMPGPGPAGGFAVPAAPTPPPGGGYGYPPAGPGGQGPHRMPAMPNVPGMPGMPGMPGPARRKGKAGLLIAAGLAFFLVGMVAVSLAVRNDGGGKQKASSSAGATGTGGTDAKDDSVTDSASQAPSGDSGDAPAKEPSAQEFPDIDVTEDYGVDLDVTPPAVEADGSGEVDFEWDYGGYLVAENNNQLVLLDSQQTGDYKTCAAETRFTANIDREQLPTGSKVCVRGEDGSISLLAVTGFSAESSPSRYITVDVTVWR